MTRLHPQKHRALFPKILSHFPSVLNYPFDYLGRRGLVKRVRLCLEDDAEPRGFYEPWRYASIKPSTSLLWQTSITMEKVTKVFFDPLAATKEQICTLLKTLPVGTAHPFRPEGLLLHHSAPNNISEIDISMHPEEYFSNAVNLAELGEGTLERMKQFHQLRKFSEEYMIQQAPAATFKVPLYENEITVFAVSTRVPTYYDLCLADSGHNTCCYSACGSFPGLTHSGDINNGSLLLHHIKISPPALEETEYVIFVSGYSHTPLTRYKEENPLVLIANHEEKVLYVVPVPLDEASIGKAILCCPMVIKADKAENTLICSILPAPTTDDHHMCSGPSLPSDSFGSAVRRADFSLTQTTLNTSIQEFVRADPSPSASSARKHSSPPTNCGVVLATPMVTIPSFAQMEGSQFIRFGNGIYWRGETDHGPLPDKSASVLPCVLGGLLQGPLLLATGEAPEDVPFDSDAELRQYYQQSRNVTILVSDNVTDNARNLTPPWRINGLFIIQPTRVAELDSSSVIPLLESLNVNAITALAGPQALVLTQVGDRYYYYRGIAKRDQFDFMEMNFGQDVTDILANADLSTLMDERWPKLINLRDENKIFLLNSGQELTLKELEGIFETLSLTEISALEEDVKAAVPQLQVLLAQNDLEKLSSRLLATIQAKITKATAGKKIDYVKFLTQDYREGDNELKKKKNALLSDLRRAVKEAQSCLGWLTQRLGNLMSSQQTSTRIHDLKRLLRQSVIRSNVEIAQSMTFESLAGLLETNADEMGVLLVNIDTELYCRILQNPNSEVQYADSCLDLDSRILHLEGLDAGIILEQSQERHSGPLVSQLGPSQPILALPYIGQRQGDGSMLAWVCWDEFVSLEDPSSVRWVDKCNEPHIATLRILMRQTISNAVCSREYDMSPHSESTGQLMGFLLMASMQKLAKMRTTVPEPSAQAPDTVTKLMRGLFGHLLTVAGSGMQPSSMVWQLMGTNPLLEVPKTPIAWNWYEMVSTLYPYTAWPTSILSKNLELLLDKVIFRLMVHNKLADGAKQYREEVMKQARKFRNMQLSNLRTIIAGLMEILPLETGYEKMAYNLLQILPKPVEDKKTSYAKLYSYVGHLARGDEQHSYFSTMAANVYTRRSAVFKELKVELLHAVKSDDKAKIEATCCKIIERRASIAQKFGVEAESVKVQGIRNIQNLLSMSSSAEGSPSNGKKNMYMRVKGDAESYRLPWQIGQGEYGSLDPLDVHSLFQVLHAKEISDIRTNSITTPTILHKVAQPQRGWDQFETLVEPKFLRTVQKVAGADEVCNMLKVPPSMMLVFISVLAPGFQLDRLSNTFKDVIYALLENPNQEIAKPTRQLFGRAAIADNMEV